MDLRVAVHTSAIEVPHRIGTSQDHLVSLLVMAALTELRDPQRQKPRVIRAVRGMARDTVLPGRRMLPEERPALFLVAGIALIVYRVGADELIGLRAVRIVARGTFHPQRGTLIAEEVTRALKQGLAYLPMA